MIKDLRSYLEYLSKHAKLGNVNSAVSPELEISAITDRENKEHRYESRTLLFNKVDGYEMPVATNLMGSYSVLKDLFSGFDVADFLSNLYYAKDISLIKGAKTLIDSKPNISRRGFGGYRKVASLSELPIIKTWPNDAGKFITLPLVITRSPKDGSTNVGVYRMQVFDGETTGMHCQVQKGGAIHILEAREVGKPLDVSISIGTDPFNVLSAVAPIPHGINEFAFAGIVRKAKTDLLDCAEYPAVPANSEIIINGYVDPNEARNEGPYGDHTGYYSIQQPTFVFHIKDIYARENAIYAASVVGFPWSEDGTAGKFLMEYLKPMLRLINPNIIDIELPAEGAFTNMCFINVRKRFPGDANKAMFSILGMGQLSLTKIIVAFDEDVDIHDLGRVIWGISTRVDPDRDIKIIKGVTTDTLDHTSNVSGYGSKMLIDATKKTKEEGYTRKWPDTIVPDKDILKEIDKKWRQIS